MGWFPKARRVPIPQDYKVLRNDQDRGILHVAVSGRSSLAPWDGNTWHMYVAKDGSCEQYVDSRHRAYASGDANDDAFHIETEGGLGTADDVNAEPWTPEQARTLAEIMVWREQEDGTPLDVLPDSRPGRRGWGPHRLGIDPWRVGGGEHWSSHYGKLCPGDAKVAQIPEIVQLAQKIKEGDDDMPLNDADAQKVADKLLRTRLKLKDGSTPQVGSILVGIIDRLKSQATTLGEHGLQLDDIEDFVDGDEPAPPAA